MAQESWKREKEETACQTPEGPILCANNCGFFGQSATMNMCSKCYRDTVLKQAKVAGKAGEKGSLAAHTPVAGDLMKATESGVMNSPNTAGAPEFSSSSTSSPVSLESPAKSEARPSQPNRCFSCKKRVGLTGFKCRCENVFCSLHRHSDKHVCSYDYKAAGRDAIAKANPIVKADKIDKI